MSSEYLREHQTILREFQNATLWPKHLLVHYTWKHTGRIHVTGGLYLIFTLGKHPPFPFEHSIMRPASQRDWLPFNSSHSSSHSMLED